jgi:NAD(P)-dependent dehydrogenase (short-subunit alcohol dehydrogenase family)
MPDGTNGPEEGVARVTGGSRRIGAGVALRLADEGAACNRRKRTAPCR